jgi:hypothetical protein
MAGIKAERSTRLAPMTPHPVAIETPGGRDPQPLTGIIEL